jgi:hypothetical protein
LPLERHGRYLVGSRVRPLLLCQARGADKPCCSLVTFGDFVSSGKTRISFAFLKFLFTSWCLWLYFYVFWGLTRIKLVMKISLLWNSMTYIQNTHRFRGFKLMFADWLKFSLISNKLNFNQSASIDLKHQFFWFDVLNWCLISRKNSDQWCTILIWSPAFLDIAVWLGHYCKLHFHIYYLFVGFELYTCHSFVIIK